jgi:hypothetical protein
VIVYTTWASIVEAEKAGVTGLTIRRGSGPWNPTPPGALLNVPQKERALFNALDQWFEVARFGADVQHVMALRIMRIASGGPNAATEAQQMISEKVAAFGEAQVALMTALATGSSLDTAAEMAYAPFRACVRANSQRLGS